MAHDLPPGMKQLSTIFQVRSIVPQLVVDAFTQTTIQTGVDAINKEALVIWEIDLQVSTPDMAALPAAGAEFVSTSLIQLTDRTQTGILDLSDVELIARKTMLLKLYGDAAGAAVSAAVLTAEESPSVMTDVQRDIPIAIVTNDQMFLAIDGNNNAFTHNGHLRMFVQRVQIVAADLYAALIEQRLP